jgi:hypothetical protein
MDIWLYLFFSINRKIYVREIIKIMREISGSHGGEYEDDSFLGNRPESTWWWTQNAPLKSRSTPTRLHGAVSKSAATYVIKLRTQETVLRLYITKSRNNSVDMYRSGCP